MADPSTADHVRHDPLLIAAYAAGDTDGEDAARAEALVAACEDCRLLALDLRSIASAANDLAGWAVTAPRDFRISPHEADRSRRRSLLRRIAAGAGLRESILRPAGVGLAALGLVGILVTSAGLGAPAGTGAGAGAGEAGGYAAQLAPSDAKAGSTAEAAAAPARTVGVTRDARGGGSDQLAAPTPGSGAATNPRTIVGAVSVVLLVAGVLLYATAVWRRRGGRA